MEIIIKHNSRETIYEQIISQIKLLIAKGELKIGDPLPSIRKLAQSLEVSVISVQRAYDELQNDGIVESIAGKGCFISANVNANIIKEEFFEEIEEYVLKIIEISKKNSVDKDEVVKLINIYWDNL